MTEAHENPPIAAEEAVSTQHSAVSGQAAPAPAEPPAAALVRDGVSAAEANELRAQLEAERKSRAAAESGRKSAEFKAAEAERNVQYLKDAMLLQPYPGPPKAKRKFATLMNHPWQ